MVWLYWSLSHLPRQDLNQDLGCRKAAEGTDSDQWPPGPSHLRRHPKAQGADSKSLDSAVLRPSWPQTIPCSCLPVAWITELSHQFRLMSHQFRLYLAALLIAHLLYRINGFDIVSNNYWGYLVLRACNSSNWYRSTSHLCVSKG
jgi:hypothetical protein